MARRASAAVEVETAEAASRGEREGGDVVQGREARRSPRGV
jgi:hypothetical protein